MLNSMIYKIEAFILAITLFFVGVVYGDKPIEVEFECEFSNYEIIPEEQTLDIVIKCKNVGRPFEGSEPHDVNVSIYKIVDGKKVYLRNVSGSDHGEPQPVLVKKDESFTIRTEFSIATHPNDLPPGMTEVEPGVYSTAISVYGCEKVYENILIIK